MEVVRKNLQDIVKGINCNSVHSAWSDVEYGGCQFGAFSAATPVEHALEIGLMIGCVHILG